MRARQSRSSPDGAEEKNPRASRRASRGGEAARNSFSAGMSRCSVAVKSLPNFYFHCTTAYDILRHCGIELGKRDFMGTPVSL